MLVDEGPARIRELIALGVAFDRGADGDFVKGLEAAHSYPRILHSGGDATGTAIEKALVARLRASGVRVIEHAFLVDLSFTAGGSPGSTCSSAMRRHPPPRRTSPDDGSGSTPTPSCSRPAAPESSTPTRRTRRSPPATASPLRCAPVRTSPTSSSSSSTRRCWQADQTASPGGGAVAAGESFLVSEAVRGEGATLIDEHGPPIRVRRASRRRARPA